MLKILVVDDEENIRKGIVKIISRLEETYQVIGEAANGFEAMEFIEQLKPDLVISDIKMPKMDGIQLIKNLELKFPEIKKVILSGFEEFDFIRQTMKNGVADYLLKPVDKEQLAKLLKVIEENIEKENKKKINNQNLKLKLNESFPLLRDQFLNELVTMSKYTENDIEGKFQFYNIKVEKGNYHVIIVSIDNIRRELEKIGVEDTKINNFIIRNITEETVSKHVTFFSFENERGLVIVCSLADDKKQIYNITDEIYENLREYTKFRFTISIGREIKNLKDLKISYDDSLEKLKQRFYNDTSSVTYKVKSYCVLDRNMLSDISKRIQIRLKNCIDNRESKNLIIIITEINNYVKENNFEPSVTINTFTEIFTRLEIEVESFKEAMVDIFGMSYSYFKSIDVFDTLDEIVNFTNDILTQIVLRMNIISVRKEQKAIEVVKSYVVQHYNEDIKLTHIAELVFMNTNYFSGFFKKHTGESFIDYLTKVRIGKAKEFLKDLSVKTYEVGQLVGYEDPPYFNKVFKKVVGISPGEYRNLIG